MQNLQLNYLMSLFGLDQSHEKKVPAEILALTFTQKAANEMRIRVAQRLSTFLNSDLANQDPLFAYANDLGEKLPDKT